MIVTKLNDKSRQYLVHGGDSRVFGEDADHRRQFNQSQVDARFDEVWQQTIAPALEAGQPISVEEARELLSESRHPFITDSYEFRQFSVDAAAFIARLDTRGDQTTCDQLWSVGAHRDPTRLCVHFERIDDLTQFAATAARLGYRPKDLLLELAMDFLRKFTPPQ